MNDTNLKKKKQLGMNPSTASNRLVKDMLFLLIERSGLNSCHHCKKEMTRETFSIEHIVSWLDSDDPIGLYFNLTNISFSHLACNISAGRRVNKRKCPDGTYYCSECKTIKPCEEFINRKYKYDAMSRQCKRCSDIYNSNRQKTK